MWKVFDKVGLVSLKLPTGEIMRHMAGGDGDTLGTDTRCCFVIHIALDVLRMTAVVEY